MAPLAARALTFSAICASLVLVTDLFVTVNSGVFERNAVKTFANESAVFLVVFGFSLIGAVLGLGIAATKGRHLSAKAAVIASALVAAIALVVVFVCDHILGYGASYLLDFDGVAFVEEGFIVVAIWWILSSFLATFLLCKPTSSALPPNKSLERTRDG